MRKFAIAMALTAGLSAPAVADIVKCQQGIEKNGTKLEASILKALTKCKDGYRKAVVKGDPLATPAISCQAGLEKAVNFNNVASAMAKTKAALAKLVAPLGTACSDADLATLGHLPTVLFGDRFQRLILLAALKGAYETQQALIADFSNILQGLGAAGCAHCAALTTPPCIETVCDIHASSGFETRVVGTPLTGAITGNTVVSGCEWQNVLPNEIGLLGGPNLGLKPTSVLGQTVCNVGYRTHGLISCAGSTAPKVTYTTCQDSDTSDGDECESGATFCQADPDATTGGACVTFPGVLPTAAQGDAYILSSTRLRVSSAVGGDGVACTPDDTYTATPTAIIPTTTGTATATVLDYNNTNGNTQTEGPTTGATGPSCAVARSGSSTGLNLVGAFPGADTVGSPLQDTVTRVSIVCQ
jgi:hypothetical protein